jgi:hypothetical protein
MTIRDPSDFSGQFSTVMPKPTIPMRRVPTFIKALWLLALLLVAGVAYSFWRISAVPTPKLDLPPGAQTSTKQPG